MGNTISKTPKILHVGEFICDFTFNIILFNNGLETHYQCQDRKNAFK